MKIFLIKGLVIMGRFNVEMLPRTLLKDFTNAVKCR